VPGDTVTSGDGGALRPMESATSGGGKAFAPKLESLETTSGGQAYAPIVEPVSPAKLVSVTHPYRAPMPTERTTWTLESMFVAIHPD